MKLDWKIALVTGWASGIGLAISKNFALEWAKVFIADINESSWIKAEKKVKNSSFIKLDVSSEKAWQEAIEQIWEIDILVNNAGIMWNPEKMGSQNPEEISVESWDLVHKINLTSVMLGCKYAMKSMKNRNWCSIINMASRSWKVWLPWNCAYASTKAAILNHTKSVALHCAKSGYDIRCNSISPASIMTPIWEELIWGDKGYYETLCENIPMNRFWTSEEVAKACVFLASEDSSYMTWTDLNLDWGLLAGTKTSPGEK